MKGDLGLMEPSVVGYLGIMLVLVLMVAGLPIAFLLIGVGFCGLIIVSGGSPALRILALVPYDTVASYSFSVVPLFLVMGNFCSAGGLAADILRTTRTWVGGLPGGLAQATIVGGAAFGAVSGSGMAATAALASAVLPEMDRMGVDRKLAFGTIAAAGTLDPMIPPSILMVVYALLTEQSVSKLLIAGVLPGFVAAANFMILIYFMVKRNPQLSPTIKGVTWGEKLSSLSGIWGIGSLGILVLGGIYFGFFTPNEAGGIGAFGALILVVASRRLRWSAFRDAIYGTVRATSMIFLIIVGAFVFSRFLALTGVPSSISKLLSSGDMPGWALLAGIILLYIIMGAFIDMMAAMFLTMPILYPAVIAAGYDPIWFGVIVVHLCIIGLISPPFGLSLFILKGVVRDTTLGEIYKGVTPFLLVEFVTLALYVAFPQIALFLPGKMAG